MKAFLITFKPASENPERGWPLEQLQRLITLRGEGRRVEEKWRFHNRKDVTIGDRVFLLLQGKGGPAIIGYGKIARKPERTGIPQAVIEFESLVDPVIHVLANREDLRDIGDEGRLWKAQASGVKLPEAVAHELEWLVVGKTPKPRAEMSEENPDWLRDELIIALDVYFRHRPNPPGKGSEEIRQLSENLRRLSTILFPTQKPSATFRNENGVYMKLMNFRRLDPEYTAGGRTGLTRGARVEEQVWKEFADDPTRCGQIASAILSSADDPEAASAWLDSEIEGIEEAEEGRVLTRKHVAYERNRKLMEIKRREAVKRYGKLVCEACNFDFAERYGSRGNGFIECHHTKPVSMLIQGHKTHIRDLALVCSNCHRIIHRSRPWLSIAQVKQLIDDSRQTSNLR
jgi:5-methylcytosine-specific restriction protein A